MLHHHLSAIAQSEGFEAKVLVFGFAHDSALGRQFLDKGFILHIVDPCGDFGAVSGIDSAFERCFGGIHGTFFFLVEVNHHQVGVGGANELLHNAIHGFHREHRHHLAHHFIFGFDRSEGFFFKEVACAHASELVAIDFVAVVVLLFELAQIFSLSACIFSGGEAEFLCA